MDRDLRLSELQDGELRPATFKEKVAGKVLRLFQISVVVTGALTIALSAVDATMIWLDVIEPEQRLVTERVLMALIAATIVELGAALATIVFALFRVPKEASNDASEAENL